MPEIIRLDNVYKKFIIHHEKHRSFQDVVVNLFSDNGSSEEFWALEDVSFGVRKGETLGIIGQNGSGKSTILKLISRIIEPTAGKITTNGTVSSLLELGAGFHPDLTGRDNVFLNGSLLGFTRREMESMFDEIVEFSELERFIDVPVKHYSSGMYMRLAFAVAINVDPDILLIDEVLAVGDKAFQDKCMERLRDFQSLGKTIVFVSHSLGLVKNLCNRAIWIDKGKIRSISESKKVVFDYLCEVEVHQEAAERDQRHSSGVQARASQRSAEANPSSIQILDVKLLGKDRFERRDFGTGDDVVIRIYYGFQDKHLPQDCRFSVGILDANGTPVHTASYRKVAGQVDASQGRGILEAAYPALPLLEGTYSLSVAVWPGDSSESPIDVYHHKCRFSMTGGSASGGSHEEGLVSLRHVWLDSAGLSRYLDGGTDAAGPDGQDSQLPSIGRHTESANGLPWHIYVGENDAEWLRDGWYPLEGTIPRFRWTAPRASLAMVVPQHACGLFLKAADPNAAFRQLKGRVLLRDAVLGEFQLHGPETQCLSFALGADSCGRADVTIEVEPPAVPARLGINSDTRELGLVVYEIWSE